MRIDLHCHTKATKKSESPGRNVDKATFINKILGSQGQIVAITNHNQFDYIQYSDFLNDKFQVWPGVELDVKGSNSEGHCILISNPKEVIIFDDLIKEITLNSTPDNFSISIENLCAKISNLNLIVIAHYGNKKPNLSDDDINSLRSLLTSKTAFFLEPQNLRSAGIYCAHDLNAIVGSDHLDWNTYPGKDKELPELKLPVDNFEKFFLLIKKDPQVIKTFLDQKLYGSIDVQPFSDCKLHLDIFKDINIVFGGKGTGKTEILRAIEKVFQQSGTTDVAKYYASDKKTTYDQMTTIVVENEDFTALNINNCSESFKSIKTWNEKTVTTTKQYHDWCKTKDSEVLGKNFGFISAMFGEIIDSTSYTKSKQFFTKYKQNIIDLLNEQFTEYLPVEEEKQLKALLLSLKMSIINNVIHEFCKLKALELEKVTIDKMKAIHKSKKGTESKPSGTGLLEQYGDCIAINNNASTILKTLATEPKNSYELLGNLIDKGSIYQKKTVVVDPEFANSKYAFKLGKSKIQTLRNLKGFIESIKKDSYSSKVKESISNFNNMANPYNVLSIEDFLGVFAETVKADKITPYTPSNGEQSMLVLNYALLDDTKKYFVLDEPEMSVGHKYINQVIVPRLKELARQGKVVVVSTHDANIAIRTLPFLSIYREDLGAGKYTTYVGNPFVETMRNYDNEDLTISWAKTSIDTLEGGKEAFIERGEAYGKERI
jgi:predicted ATPase